MRVSKPGKIEEEEKKRNRAEGHHGSYASNAKLRRGMPYRRLAGAYITDAPEAGVFNPANRGSFCFGR